RGRARTRMRRPASRSSHRLSSGLSTTSIGSASGTKAVLLVRAIAEGLVGRTAAAAERRPLTLVQKNAVGVDDSHVAGREQGAICGCAELEWLFRSRRRRTEPARSQGA